MKSAMSQASSISPAPIVSSIDLTQSGKLGKWLDRMPVECADSDQKKEWPKRHDGDNEPRLCFKRLNFRNNRKALSNEPSDSMSGPQRKHQKDGIDNLIKLQIDFLLAPKQARLPIR